MTLIEQLEELAKWHEEESRLLVNRHPVFSQEHGENAIIIRQAISELKANICDVCNGTPISVLPCMCGGSGRASDAVPYLREQLIKAQSELKAKEGWVLIPKEPTEKMMLILVGEEGSWHMNDKVEWYGTRKQMEDNYKAMISAKP